MRELIKFRQIKKKMRHLINGLINCLLMETEQRDKGRIEQFTFTQNTRKCYRSVPKNCLKNITNGMKQKEKNTSFKHNFSYYHSNFDRERGIYQFPECHF